MSAPRILHLVNAFSVGGVEVLALELFRRLHPARFEVEVACLKEPGTLAGELAASGIRVESGFVRGRFDLFGAGRLARALAGRRFDLILVEPGRNALLLAGVARQVTGARATVSWIHATGKWGRRSQFNGTERRILRRLDAVVAIAESQRDHLVADEGLDPKNLVVIHNGVDAERFRPRPEARSAARAALGIAPDEVAVGIVASLTPEKGHALLVEAVARIASPVDRPDASMAGAPSAGAASAPPRLRLLIIGEGPERAAIESAIARAGLSSRATLLGLRRDLDAAVYPALDIQALVSHPFRETLPISLMEGMACGLPVIATRVGSVADLVADNETGTLVAPGDADALAAALSALARDSARRAALGRAGRKRIVARFSLDRMVESYASLFDRLAS